MDLSELKPQMRVWHEDCGSGTVLQLSSQSVTIFWDRPPPRGNTRQAVHDAPFVRGLLLSTSSEKKTWPELKASES